MSKFVEEYFGLRIGDRAQIGSGPYAGSVAVVKSIEIEAGAKNGWFTVVCHGTSLLYPGEELIKIREAPNE